MEKVTRKSPDTVKEYKYKGHTICLNYFGWYVVMGNGRKCDTLQGAKRFVRDYLPNGKNCK